MKVKNKSNKTKTVKAAKKTVKAAKKQPKPQKKQPNPQKKTVKVAKKTSVQNNMRKHTGVQAHGQEWEDDLVTIFVSPSEIERMNMVSYTSVHDIPKELNKLTGKNVSIKATKTNRVDFGSAIRTLDNVTNDSPLEVVVVKYDQIGDKKHPKSIVRLDFTDAKELLFGNGNLETIKEEFNELDTMLKHNNPDYKNKAKQIKNMMPHSYLSVAPKVGNVDKKRAGRLQISLTNINKLVKEHPELVIQDEYCNDLRGCLRTLDSSVRTIGKKKV